MTLKNLLSLSGCLLAGTVLMSCGNKGDLFLISDPADQQDMQQLQRVLDTSGIPAADAADVDDQKVYVKPDKDSKPASGIPPIDK